MIRVLQNRLLNTFLHKFSFLFSCIYYTIFITGVNPVKSIPLLILATITAIGIAGFGYFLNDLTDLEEDLSIGKQNMLSNVKKSQRRYIGFGFLILALGPWIWLPFDIKSIFILGVELLLFAMYSLPPIRLKERGLLGVISDALYAHTIPCLLAMYTFSGLKGIPNINMFHVFLFGIWLTLSGIRNIISHQIDDLLNDTKTNTQTFLVRFQKKKNLIKISLWVVIAFEVILFCGILIPRGLGSIVICWFGLALIHIIRNFRKFSNDLNLFQIVHHRILNEFYEIIFPIVLLFTIVLSQSSYWGLILFHCIVFSMLYFDYFERFLKQYVSKFK